MSAFYSEPEQKALRRDYLRCENCALVFVPSFQFISREQEKAHYDLHQNHPADQGYRLFLNRLLVPMKEKLKSGSRGLDFGSGPGPTLSLMFEELGFPMKIYDHFYANDEFVLQQQYDFITTTETVEHLHHPKTELERLWSLLKPGGLLGIMTKLVIDRDAFANWHYKNDPTHVCFFSNETFRWLADLWHAKIEFTGNDVILFEKIKKEAG
ncbi:class I SAM-dependent methyltransferase [Kaarinaea lacus]